MEQRSSNDAMGRRSSPRPRGSSSLQQFVRRTKSSIDTESVTSVQLGPMPFTSHWGPCQEYSHIKAYDPIEDILHGHKYASEWRQLHFHEIFRFARCFDWLLMVLGVILAILGSLVTPWLYYWAGVALHDIFIFETCNATTTIIDGKEICDIPHFCDMTLSFVGKNLLLKIVWGWLVHNVLHVGYYNCFIVAADRQTKSMRVAYFESIVRKDMAWFDLYAGKDFAKEMIEQVTNIRLGIGGVIPNFINLICTVVAMTAIVFLLNYKAAIAFLSFIPVSVTCVYIGNWAEKKRASFSERMFEKPYLVARESFVNIKVIKMYEAERKQASKFSKSLDVDTEDGEKCRREEIKWMAAAALSSGSIWLLLNIATSLVFWFGHDEFKREEDFCRTERNGGILSSQTFLHLLQESRLDLKNSPGEILLVYFGLMYITLHAIEVPTFLSLMQIARNNATSVFFIIDWKCRIDNVSDEGKIPKRSAVGRLDFSNVSFRYPQKPEETVIYVKQLTIYSGQYVAFAGPSSSGKNTILKLIPRLYDCCTGFITLDAVNLQNYNIHWLRRQICVISEVPVIFSGTISENILFGKLDASEEEIVKACQLADVHHVIEKLPNGYNTTICCREFGDHLTRNEKRQLCLARAYLHRSRVILMDNPVHPEDDELEGLFLRFVDHFRDSATIILASTNVTALSKRADCIYYMENGRIIESGSHIQLILARGRYYSRLEGTINLSTESRNKFESQLKTYKYTQLLQKKRRSSALTDSSWEENIIGGGDEPIKPRKGLWNSILKPFSGKHKQNTKGLEPSMGSATDVEEGGEGKGKLEGGKKSILRQGGLKSQEIVKISSLEEAYRQYNGGRRSNEHGYMHQRFGMMGFQRMNFARPITNYSTHIIKKRNSSVSNFAGIGSHSLSILQGRKLSLLRGRGKSGNNDEMSQINETERKQSSGHLHVRFSSDTPLPHTDIHDQSRAPPSNIKKTSFASGKTKLTPVKNQSATKTVKSVKSIKKSVNLVLGNSNLSKQHKGKAANVSKNKKSTVQTNISGLNLSIDRDSLQDALKDMTRPTSFHLNEHVEIDNVSIHTEDLDKFLAEYHDGVYSILNSEVKGFWRDIFFVVKHDWLCIIPAMLASAVLGLSIPYQTWIVGTFFQILGIESTNRDVMEIEITHLGIFMLTTGVVTAIAAFIQEFLFALAGRRMTRFNREKLFSHILTQDLEWFDSKAHDIGILTFQLYADIMIVQHTLLMFYGIVIQAVFNVTTSVIFAAIETTNKTLPIAIGFIAAVPIQIGIVYLSSKMELREAKKLEERFKVAGNFAQEFFTNLKTWFSLGAEGFFISQHKKILEKEYKFIRVSNLTVSCLHNAVHTSSWLLYGVFIYLTLMNHDHQNHKEFDQVKYPSPFTKPTLIGFLMIVTELLIFGAFRVGHQIAVLIDVESGKTAAHRIMRILINLPVTNPPSKSEIISDEMLPEDFYKPPPEIGLTNVTYFCPGTDQFSQEGHLRGVSMTIASSSYVAIVGPPGSGKSALCNIILRMYNPTAGILDFNGDDAFMISPKITRRLMGLVEYDPCLFDCSVFENIRYGKLCTSQTIDAEVDEADKVAVEEATKLCNCHFDILDLPEDYNTLVDTLDKTAYNFSLKQRISYARALFKKPKILIVDDATTSVDVETDNKILEVLANVRGNRTLIVFSHKIEPVRDADNIFVLWAGEIVESGRDSFLLAKRGYYYEMYMTQKVLEESMRNSPQQLNTIRYNIKGKSPSVLNDSAILADLASKQKIAKRKSSFAFVKFLDEKVNKMKQEKEQIRLKIEKELPKLEMEERQRELLKEEKRKMAGEIRKSK